MIAAYRDPDRASGRKQLRSVIDALTVRVPAGLVELRKLGRTLARRAEMSWPTSTARAPAPDPPRL